MTDILGKLLGRDAIEKRIRALEAWRDEHMADIGEGGAAQRVAELLELRKAVNELAERLDSHLGQYSAEFSRSIQTSNNNLNSFIHAINEVEMRLKDQLGTVVDIVTRIQSRVHALDVERLHERE